MGLTQRLRMRSARLFAFLLLCVAALTGPGGMEASCSTNHHVILITVDGLAAYYLDDPQAPIPTIRRLADEGATAAGMRVANPAVTWPNHTTLVTGVRPARHSVLFNGVLERGTAGQAVRVDGARSKADLIACPTLYDQLHRAGYRSADINWPCTRSAETLEDSFPDVPDQITHMTPRLRGELIETGWLHGRNSTEFRARSAPTKDQVWTAAALHVLRKRRPNLMLFHLLITDSTQHKYGPQSPAAYTALALADAHVQEILRALNDTGLKERTTVFLTADHGFETALKIVNPNVAFRNAGLLEVSTTPLLQRARAQAVSEGGIAMVYLTNPDTRDADRQQVIDLMRRQEGIQRILEEPDFGALGLPDPKTNRQMADLILVAAEGYAFNNEARGDELISEVTLAAGNQGHHGFLSTNPKMNAAFIAWGRGIRSGLRIGMIDNVDVAPTIARVLGQDLTGVDGRVLEELLTKLE